MKRERERERESKMGNKLEPGEEAKWNSRGRAREKETQKEEKKS